MARRIVIKTPSRLHLGIVNPFNKAYRLYIGVAVAVDQPRTITVIYPDEPLSIEGCRSEETFTRLKPLIEEYNIKRGKVVIEECVPKHVGLGSTTQLLLSVAHGLALANNVRTSIPEIAKKVGLGVVSGVGVYVYMYGGFVIDAGKARVTDFPELLLRLRFPSDWRFLVAIPPGKGLDELSEGKVFERGESVLDELVWQASHTLFTELVPSVLESNFDAFSRSLAKFQETVGKMFSTYQGGVFAHYSQEAIEALKSLGIIGVGQSSWGPTVYGVVNTHEKAVEICKKLAEKLSGVRVLVAKPQNRGAEVRLLLG